MAYIKLVGNVKGAITISGSQLVGNHIETASWISGNTLRGTLAANYNGLKDNDQFLNLFCRGKVTFHGLFPLPSDKSQREDFLSNNKFPYRISLSTFSCKYQPWTNSHNRHSFVNKVKHNNIIKCESCDAPLKQTKTPDFYYCNGNQKEPIKQNNEVYLYHGTDRKTHRAMNEQLYSFTSIPDGEGFLGWLSGSKDDLNNLLQQLKTSIHADNFENHLMIPLYIGKGKKRRGYLNTKIFPVQDGDPNFINNIKPTYESIYKNNNKIIVVLQTPAICNNALFCVNNTLTVADIFTDIENVVKIKKPEFSALTLVEGWSGIHRLPRRPEYALAAGSTFVFKYNKDLHNSEKDKLTKGLMEELFKIQKDGIGERKLEGYGQIVINPPMVC